MVSSLGNYLYNLTLAFSLTINALLGGEMYENFSARNWKWKSQNKFNIVWLIDLIHWEKDHCFRSRVHFLVRKQAMETHMEKYENYAMKLSEQGMRWKTSTE